MGVENRLWAADRVEWRGGQGAGMLLGYSALLIVGLVVGASVSIERGRFPYFLLLVAILSPLATPVPLLYGTVRRRLVIGADGLTVVGTASTAHVVWADVRGVACTFKPVVTAGELRDFRSQFMVRVVVERRTGKSARTHLIMVPDTRVRTLIHDLHASLSAQGIALVVHGPQDLMDEARNLAGLPPRPTSPPPATLPGRVPPRPTGRPPVS